MLTIWPKDRKILGVRIKTAEFSDASNKYLSRLAFISFEKSGI